MKNKLNKKGFTLIESLIAIAIFSSVLMIILPMLNSTMSVTKKDAYKIMKNNIVSAAKIYLEECDNGTITCQNLTDVNNEFSVIELKNNGFINNLESPIDGKDLSQCLILKVRRIDNNKIIDLVDNCY